jgi:SAM-dependent methyltransferase
VTAPISAADDRFGDDYVYFFGGLLDGHPDAEAELVWRLLGLEPGLEVLDLACGYGRIAAELAARGCRVTGLDAVAGLLERARRDAAARGVEVAYEQGDMRDLPWTERFDRIVLWFTSFGYFEDDGNRRVLAGAARALRPGGRMLVEMIDRDWLLRRFQYAAVEERDGDHAIDRHDWDPLTGRVSTERTVIRGGEVRRVRFFVRLFTFTELRDWLLAAGFSGVEGYDETGGPLGPESQRMIVVATR